MLQGDIERTVDCLRDDINRHSNKFENLSYDEIFALY